MEKNLLSLGFFSIHLLLEIFNFFSFPLKAIDLLFVPLKKFSCGFDFANLTKKIEIREKILHNVY